MAAPRILFLDDDHVLRILLCILRNGENDASIRAWLHPEVVDLAPLARAAWGLRPSEGAHVETLADADGVGSDADIMIFRRGQITERMLDAHPRLRLVQRLGARTEGIDLAALARRNVRLSCLPRQTLDFTAEHVLLLMLALGKKLLAADAAVRKGAADTANVQGADAVAYNWAGISGVTGLHGRTLGIIGLGEVGSLVARMARGFGMTVLYHKPHRADPAIEALLGVRYAELDELLAGSDYVSLNAANVPGTRAMANAAFFAKMRRSAFLINTSRGQLVDEDALYQALISGQIAGAGLDVHGVEPRAPGDRFSLLPNVVLTPHLAGGARSGVLDEFKIIIDNCQAALRGEPVSHQVPIPTSST